MQATIKRLTSSRHGLAFYNADPQTGAVEGLLPGEAGYLQAAFESAWRAGAYLAANQLPAEGLSSEYDLNLDPNQGVGALLLASDFDIASNRLVNNNSPLVPPHLLDDNRVKQFFSAFILGSNRLNQIYSSFNSSNPNENVKFLSHDLAGGGIAYLIEDQAAGNKAETDFIDFIIELTPDSVSPARIPNSNPWINADQTSFVDRAELNPKFIKSYEESLFDINEAPADLANIKIKVLLVLNRREVDHTAVEQSRRYKFDRFYDANELLSLSYKDLHQYTNSLTKEDLTELYGADPADIDTVIDFLTRSGATNIDTTATRERRTLTFEISGSDFVRHLTDGNLLISKETLDLFPYVNKNGELRSSYLEAQGEGAEAFAKTILGIDILGAAQSSTAEEPDNRTTRIFDDFIYPIDVAKSYQYPGLDDPTAGSGTRIGLIGSGGNQAMLNWQDSEHYKQYLETQGRDPLVVPRFQSLAPAEPDQQDLILEQMLDVSVLTSISPGASIIATGQSDSEYLDYASLIYLSNPVDVISSSVQNDLLIHKDSPARDQLYLDAVLRGITIVAAAGDRGIANIDDPSVFLPGRGQPNPTTDTGSAAVLSVGGTALAREGVTESISTGTTVSPRGQLTWNEFNPQSTYVPIGVSVESGVDTFSLSDFQRASKFFDLHAGVTQGMASSGIWQPSSKLLAAGYQRDRLTGIWSNPWRVFPDISMLSGGNAENGINLGYQSLIYTNNTYSNNVLVGTSAAAPLISGLIANVTSELRSRHGDQASVGFLNPLLYELYNSNSRDQVYFDVPAGSNNSNVFASPASPEDWDGIYAGYDINTVPGKAIFYPLNGTLPNGELDRGLSATAPGFDSATGLGSVNGTALLNQLLTLYPLSQQATLPSFF